MAGSDYPMDTKFLTLSLTVSKNFEIPGLIAEGRGDVMITENAEAKL